MPIRHRSSSSWPAVLSALALFSVGTLAIAVHRGWINKSTWKSTERILLLIRSEFANGAEAAGEATPQGDLGPTDPLPDEVSPELDGSPIQPAPRVPAKMKGSGKVAASSGGRPTPVAGSSSSTPANDVFEDRRQRLRERHGSQFELAASEEAAEPEAVVEPPIERPAARRKEAAPNNVEAAPPVTKSPARPTPGAANPADIPDDAADLASDGGPAAKPSELMSLDQIDQLIADERDVQALQELTKWYWKTPSKRDVLRPKMDELSQRIYFSPQPHYFEPHVVANNEQLRNIAKEYQLSWEYLQRLNRTDARRIRHGQRLKVLPGPFHVLVNIRAHELIVHNNGCYVKRYVIGAGKDRSTPIGVFQVKNKLVNPTYYPPEGGIVKADDPANPLGNRWIDIGDSFGIHGTNEPDTVGKDLSRGCVRMRNEEVMEVYDFLIVGSEVRIQR